MTNVHFVSIDTSPGPSPKSHYFLDQSSQKRVALCVVAIVLGGCMAVTIFSHISLKGTVDPLHFGHFYTVALAGEVISVLPLVS